MARYLWASLLLVASMPLAHAQTGRQEDELRLLQSWGFQPDARGQLVFNQEINAHDEYQPWMPDLSRIKRPLSGALPVQPLQPLVVSAKKKHQE